MTLATQNLGAVRHDFSLLTADDLHLFNEGTHYQLQQKLGAHRLASGGVYFAVWAPNARQVSVIGNFNGWDGAAHPLRPRATSGIWEGVVPGIGTGVVYKYHVVSQERDYAVDKADPLGVFHQVPPETASVVWDLDYDWNDAAWMTERGRRNALGAPISIYEVHLGSWRRAAGDQVPFLPPTSDDSLTQDEAKKVPDPFRRSLSYRELAPRLADHVEQLGFTHVELLPVMEHPFFGSWGYQTTGYFAPSSRYGTPQDFKYLVDYLHQRGIGVILDWVPSHFPNDQHGLAYFDGTHLFEHADPRQGYHPDWNSHIFNYGRNEVRSFLLSSALFWLEEYHADALRVDAVASMLYLDYSRKEGEWIPNKYGGRENLEAIDFLRTLNTVVYERYPDVQTIAEESTSWPMVSRPAYVGGLGFGLKWDMGWMHDTLRYLAHDPVHRRFHHHELTFRMIYAFHENFVLSLSHDEVVHGKGSLLAKMPGDDWQKFANLRLLYGYMFGLPGKKLLFMGGEFGQRGEWHHDGTPEWQLRRYPEHTALEQWVGSLNRCYASEPALHELDCDPAGFEWIDANDSDESVLSFLRKSRGCQAHFSEEDEPRSGCGRSPDRATVDAGSGDPRTTWSGHEMVAVACNFTPVPRQDYQLGVPRGGHWREILNSDAKEHGGSGWGNFGGVDAAPIEHHGRPYSLSLTLPPLAVVFLKSESA